MGAMDWRDRISIDPRVNHGKPSIKGTRVMVSIIVGSIADGDTPEQIIEAWPQLSPADITAALRFAAKAAGHADIAVLQGDAE
jgi:uncharacterized protein (DUF433 family)